MPYADFTYYTDTFLGQVIKDESQFLSCEKRASDYLDAATMGRADEASRLAPAKVKDCVCALSEQIYLLNARAGAVSVTNDGLSVSYAKDAGADEQQRLWQTISQYLFLTGLLYRGVGGC